MNNPKLVARLAGLLYLFVVIASSYALVATSGIVVRGDLSATMTNLTDAEFTYRLGIAATLLSAIAYTGVVALLYALFKPVNPALAVVSAFVGLAGCIASITFLGDQLGALALTDGAGGGMDAGSQAMARHGLRLASLGSGLSLVCFGFYCLTLSALVFGSTFLPKLLGVPLLIAGVGWLVGNLAAVIAPGALGSLASVLLPISGAGELLFTLWILAFGVNPDKWRAQVGLAPLGKD